MKAQIILSALLLLGLANASAQWQNTPAVAADYTRLTKTYNAPQGDAQLTLTVDFPDAYAPYAGEVNQWLVHLADRAFLSGDSFGGLPTDHAALGQFVARKFFRFAAQQVKHDVAEPSPYAYTYSMLVNTQAPTFITYQLETGLQFGAKHTMMGRQLVTFIYGSGEADNDALFRQNKFKALAVARPLLASRQRRLGRYGPSSGGTHRRRCGILLHPCGRNAGCQEHLSLHRAVSHPAALLYQRSLAGHHHRISLSLRQAQVSAIRH